MPHYKIMPSSIEKNKKEQQLFTSNEQIEIVNNQINELEKTKRRTGSIERINEKYTRLNQVKTMKNKLIHENRCL